MTRIPTDLAHARELIDWFEAKGLHPSDTAVIFAALEAGLLITAQKQGNKWATIDNYVEHYRLALTLYVSFLNNDLDALKKMLHSNLDPYKKDSK